MNTSTIPGNLEPKEDYRSVEILVYRFSGCIHECAIAIKG